MRIVLASGSPRRADLLRTLGFDAAIDPPEVDEAVLPGESPEAHAERLAREKATAVAVRHPQARVIAGDTVVVRDGEILGKPADEADAVRMLLSLAGRSHRVVSALALAVPAADGSRLLSGVQVTEVTFRPFDRTEAEAYARTGEPLDKAGGYGIQGLGATLVERIAGDYSGVVGLPVPLLVRLLADAGAPYRFPLSDRG